MGQPDPMSAARLLPIHGGPFTYYWPAPVGLSALGRHHWRPTDSLRLQFLSEGRIFKTISDDDGQSLPSLNSQSSFLEQYSKNGLTNFCSRIDFLPTFSPLSQDRPLAPHTPT